MKILLASTNEGKRREIESLLGEGFEVIALSSLADISADFEETGETFRENSEAKALHFHKLTGLPTVSDDSGLCVDALGGEPGVRSARWAGENATDAERIKKLLKELDEVPGERRQAYFMASLSFADSGRIIKTTEGRVDGVILTEPAGDNGFGYDPVFYFPEAGRSFARMSAVEKNRVSHRGEAIRKMAGFLKSYFKKPAG